MCQGHSDDGADIGITTNIEGKLSREGLARQMAGLRKIVTAFAGVPGIIGLHGGLPPASSFPITGVTLTLQGGQKVEIDNAVKVRTQEQYTSLLSQQAIALCKEGHSAKIEPSISTAD